MRCALLVDRAIALYMCATLFLSFLELFTWAPHLLDVTGPYHYGSPAFILHEKLIVSIKMYPDL